jgi:hypothetical protein
MTMPANDDDECIEEWPINGRAGKLRAPDCEPGVRMLRIVAFGIGAVATLYLLVVLGMLMSWRQRALAQGQLQEHLGEGPL